MTLSSTPCSCGGNNPNCFRCWGTGMVEPVTLPDAGPKEESSKRRKRPSSQFGAIQRPSISLGQPQKLTTICPLCRSSVQHLERHMAKAHAAARPLTPEVTDKQFVLASGALAHLILRPFKSKKTDAQQGEGKTPTFHICPICAVQVKSLEKHAKKTGHGPMPALVDRAVVRSKALLKQHTSATFKCPHCRANFPNATQQASHVAGSHGKRAFQNLGYQARSTNLKAPDENPPSTVIERSSNMDAKHGWGGSFRDNGQFGSYPSHDGMDDESFS